MKKVLVYYSYSQKNAGDMAICFGLLDLLEEMPDYEITMVSRYAKKDPLFKESKEIINKYHPSVLVKPGYINFDRSKGIFSKLKSYISGWFISTFARFSKRLKEDIKDKDLILFNGGNYLRCNSMTDKLRLKALFFPIKYAKKHGKTVICMPQSTAKAKNKTSLKTIKKLCGNFDHIFIRDPISYSYFLENNICDKTKVSQSCDLAFFTKNLCKETYDLGKNDSYKNKIAINVRLTGIGDIGSISDDKIALINSIYLKLIKENTDSLFTFVCQTEKDNEPMETFYKKLQADGVNNIAFVKSNDAYYLKNVYSKHNVLVSMRLHASILSISSGTPVVGFAFEEWGFKNAGILKQFGFNNHLTYEGIYNEIHLLINKGTNSVSLKAINDYKKQLLQDLSKR
ncbi:MAG: polysaccharide pyruvyl transferase family protein [Bacilli bacterium]|nr:polysaccharide pyruvyl transferase family protein [Bacilli bacterium]